MAKSIFGPKGGNVAALSEPARYEHVQMLVDNLIVDANALRCAESLSLYIAENKYLPERMDPHPATVLANYIGNRASDRQQCINALRALCVMGPPAAPYASEALKKLLARQDQELRLEGVRAARRLGPDAALVVTAAICEAMKDEEATGILRWEAAMALASLGPLAAEDAWEALAEGLEDEDQEVQIATVRALKAMGPAAAKAAAALAKSVEKAPRVLRAEAAIALAEMGAIAAPAAAETLGLQLKESSTADASLKVLCIRALDAMGHEVVQQQESFLARAVDCKDEEVRKAARVCLAKAGCKMALRGYMYYSSVELFSAEKIAALERESEIEMEALLKQKKPKASKTERAMIAE